MQGKTMVDVHLEFHLDQTQLGDQDLRTFSERLLSQLAKLDPVHDNAFDPHVQARSGRQAILIDLVIPNGTDAFGCARHALDIVRAATRAAGLEAHIGQRADTLVPAYLQAIPIDGTYAA